MRRRRSGKTGTVTFLDHDSKVLRGNPLGDPHRRTHPVYLPPGYERETDRRYPVFYDLAGFTGSGHARVSWKNFGENVPERYDRLIAEGKMGPVIVVLPDFFTSLGGNQYVNSSAVGRYGDALLKEIVPQVDRTFRVLPGRKHRAVYGKSSGGYGAIVHAMKHADVWGAAACHSGDMYFEFCYRTEIPELLNELAKHNRSVPAFLRHFRKKQKHSGSEIHALMGIAMAATYDPDPKAPLGFHLPVKDLRTGEVDERRWKRWLKHDPVRMIDRYGKNLKKLSCLFIDCGTRDQYHLQYGTRIFTEKLKSMKIPHVYEEFDDDHSSIDYRLDVSLPLLYRAVS